MRNQKTKILETQKDKNQECFEAFYSETGSLAQTDTFSNSLELQIIIIIF